MIARRRDAAIVFALCAATLALSRLLSPEMIALGPPVCLFRFVTHLPCPFCGMTTAFTLMARGEALAALQANILGPPAYLMMAMAFLGSGYWLVTGRARLLGRLTGPGALKAVAVIIGAGWLVNIAMRVWG